MTECMIVRRMLYSGVLVQEALDVLVYRVDRELTIARNPVDRYKHIYYCVGDYGFPPPVRIKPPCPDVIPTQRIRQRMPFFKHRIEKRAESGICSQAATTSCESKMVPTEKLLEHVKKECEIASEKGYGSIKSADPLQMENIIDRMRQAPSLMIPLRREDEKRLREISSSDVMRQDFFSSLGCIHYADDIVTTDVHFEEVEEEPVLFQDASVQTSMEFKGIPRFSLPYVPYEPPYPIGMVSILEEMDKLPVEPSLVEEVKSAYVRKFQLPDEAAEKEVDLSEDVNYKLNAKPLIISRELQLETVPQPEEEEEKISIPETLSSYVSSKSEIGETISKYQVLERNIYGIDPPAPLSRDYEDALQTTIHNLKRYSERSIFEVIEDCDSVNTQRSHIVAWQRFGQEIISWAIKKAFEEITLPHQDKMDEENATEDHFVGMAAVSSALEKAAERVFEEIQADRDSLVKHELEQILEKAAANIHDYLENMVREEIEQETNHYDNVNIELVVRETIAVALEKCFQNFDED